MFEIGFSEIILIFGLALVVLGPERLPKLASSIGRWAGRARAMARQFRDQLENEADTIRSSTNDIKRDVESLKTDIESATPHLDLTPREPPYTDSVPPAAAPAKPEHGTPRAAG